MGEVPYKDRFTPGKVTEKDEDEMREVEDSILFLKGFSILHNRPPKDWRASI